MAHYVNNADFLAALIEHKNKVKEAEEKGLPNRRFQITSETAF